ncbi:MAG TPA: DUF58 domain-containing protein [Longimicrobiales bacterium]|nr:DUF58 domain-containing protein [Longimicrobiales bacterium]
MKTAPGARFLDPVVLTRIGNLELIARSVVEGFISGLHHSPAFGLSSDFAEHRAYMPGDDIRHIDWRVYGRTDRHYIRQFEADTNTDFTVILDASASMSFGSRGVTKFDYARMLAACLAYFANRQRDRVGLALFSNDDVVRIPPGARRLDLALHELDRAKPAGGAALLPPLRKLSQHLRRRSIIALISDLYEAPEEASRAIAQLRQRGNDVVVFHVLDPGEIEFAYDGALTIEDLETGETLPVVGDTLKEEYAQLMAEHAAQMRRRTLAHGFDYVSLDTSKPLDHALFKYLAARERMRTVR